jgi:type III pantothenate kinase
MQSGLFYGYVGQVDGLLERLMKEMPSAKVVATGGLAKALAAESKFIQHLEPDLTLEGLKLLWLKNRR